MNSPDTPPPESSHQEPQLFAVSQDVHGTRFTRRDFLELAATTAAIATLTGCGGGEQEGGIAVNSTEVPPTNVPVTPSHTPTPPPATATPTPHQTPTRTLAEWENYLSEMRAQNGPPTRTRIPTRTPTPTAPPLPEAVVNQSSVNLRRGPGINYPVLMVLYHNDVVQVIARIQDSSWFQVETADGTMGWISTSVVTFTFNLDDIPLATDIPTPPAPTAPPAPTSTPAPVGVPGPVPAGQTGVEYSINGQTFTLPCGSPLPPGAVCVCNCVTVPDCGCVGHTTCTCDSVCTCDTVCSCVGNSHYWYPN